MTKPPNFGRFWKDFSRFLPFCCWNGMVCSLSLKLLGLMKLEFFKGSYYQKYCRRPSKTNMENHGKLVGWREVDQIFGDWVQRSPRKAPSIWDIPKLWGVVTPTRTNWRIFSWERIMGHLWNVLGANFRTSFFGAIWSFRNYPFPDVLFFCFWQARFFRLTAAYG